MPSRRHALRTALQFARPYRQKVLLACLALLFTAGITLSLGQGMRLLIDQGLAGGSMARLNQATSLFLVLIVALAAGTYVRFHTVSWLGERIVADIRRQVFDHLIHLHPGFFSHNRALEIQSRLTTDTTLLQALFSTAVSQALRNLVTLIGGVLLLFVTNIKLTLIVLLSVPLVIGPILIFGRRVRRLSRHSQDRLADVGTYVGEALTQIKTVQAYNHQQEDTQRFGNVVEHAFDVARQRIRQRGLLILVVIILVLGAVAAMLWIGGRDVIEGHISGGELAAFVFYSVLVGGSVSSLSEMIGELQRAAGAMERIVELLDSPNAILSPAEPLRWSAPVRGELHLQDLTYAYPGHTERPAVAHVNLTVHAGETLALVGPSGAGKSTLFDLLLRFADPDQGTICVDHLNIRQVDLKALRDCFALVAQSPALFFGTVEDNIRYGKPGATTEAIVAAAKAAYAHDFIVQLPQGYQTHLGDGGIGLSGGQKQRIAIARALLADAPILLLDEATSALDAESEHQVQAALNQLMQGRTTLVIAHRLATVKHADRIAVMDQGHIVALGTHAQLMRDNPLYARLAELQFNVPEPPR